MNISICLIVKNEEKKLDKCLEPLKDLGQEIVIIDTGSTDATIEIAKKYTNAIYHFDWINDFSAARNFAMKKASNEYILFLDADEYTERADINKVFNYIRQYPDAVGQIKRRNNCMTNTDQQLIYVDMVERFFNKNLYTYKGAIHEQVTKINGEGDTLEVYELDWTVFHDGYIGTPEELKAKGLRNAELLLKDLEKDPSDSYIYYQLGQSYDLFNDYETAVKYYKQGMELDSDLSLKYVEIMTISYGNDLAILENYQEALELDCKKYEQYKENADFICMLATAANKSGNLVRAMDYYKQALKCKHSDTEGLNGFISWHNLGCIQDALGNYSDALISYNNALPYPNAQEQLNILNDKLKNAPKEKKISVIYNIKNAAKHINQLFAALENQTVGICNLELIFIDNNSNDNTFELLSDFEKKYSENVIILHSDEDMSDDQLYSTGFSYTSASHILFSKDTLIPVPDAFRLLLSGCIQTNSDFCISNYTTDYDKSALGNELLRFSDLGMNLKSYAVDFNADNNRLAAKQMRLLSEPLTGKLYNINFILSNEIVFNTSDNNNISPFENDIYNKANYGFIIENICFIRLS